MSGCVGCCSRPCASVRARRRHARPPRRPHRQPPRSLGRCARPRPSTSRAPQRPRSPRRRHRVTSQSSASPASSAVSPPPHDPGSPAERAFAAMSEAERVGQLLMVDCPSSGRRERNGHGDPPLPRRLGDPGRQQHGRRERHPRDHRPAAAARAGASPAVHLDRPGRRAGAAHARVRVLQHPQRGVARATRRRRQLQSDARTWGGQLRAAGINVDLAPVLDTVPEQRPAEPADRRSRSRVRTHARRGSSRTASRSLAGWPQQAWTPR